MKLLTELPHEILRWIGSQLDVESRIQFNRCTTHIDDRYSRKLSLDPQIVYFQLEQDFIQRMLFRNDRDPSKNHITTIRLLSHLAYTRGTLVENYFKGEFCLQLVLKAAFFLKTLDQRPKFLSSRFRKNLRKICNDIILRQMGSIFNDSQCPSRPKEPWFANSSVGSY